jgi:hypothetical protein
LGKLCDEELDDELDDELDAPRRGDERATT